MSVERVEPPTAEVLDEYWNLYSPAIRSRIVAEFQLLKRDSKGSYDDVIWWNEAFLRFLHVHEPTEVQRPSWFSENISGLTVVSFLMAVSFGVMGAYGLVYGADKASAATAGFLDIAKLCAGALVGAVGATVASKR